MSAGTPAIVPLDIDRLEEVDGTAARGGVLHGTAWLLGTPLHLWAVRVDPDTGDALDDPLGRLGEMADADAPEGPYQSTDLAVLGWPGAYAVWLVPHVR